ncbi:hypothetical protein D623_10026517 [Myotis brandtii]|uniref:Uncharacterized protein n=1 Tax=Myotis brandtii TaxID=109478 RepID=S7Q1J0_MYOBR|nr:hypothetical protein D623_10026517 [Myotis brandtii]
MCQCATDEVLAPLPLPSAEEDALEGSAPQPPGCTQPCSKGSPGLLPLMPFPGELFLYQLFSNISQIAKCWNFMLAQKDD